MKRTLDALLRDDYPPFGDGPYPAELDIPRREPIRDRWSVGFRILLALPHLVMVWILGVAWLLTSVVAWFAILLTGRYPQPLYEFAIGVHELGGLGHRAHEISHDLRALCHHGALGDERGRGIGNF